MNESEEGPYRIQLIGSRNGLTRTVNRDLLKRCYLRDPKMFFMPQLKPIPEEEVNVQWNENAIARMLDIDLFAPEIVNENSLEGLENPIEVNMHEVESQNEDEKPKRIRKPPVKYDAK